MAVNIPNRLLVPSEATYAADDPYKDAYTITEGPDYNKWDEALAKHGRIRLPKELNEPQKWLDQDHFKSLLKGNDIDREDQPDGSVILSRKMVTSSLQPKAIPVSGKEDDFHRLWGTGGAAVAPDETGTRVLDPKSFDSMWLSEPKSTGKSRGEVPMPGATSLASGYIEGIPVVGPYIKSAVEKGAAKARSMRDGTKYEDELDFVRGVNTQNAADNPLMNATGQVTGSVAGMIPLASTTLGAKALGMTGSLGQRVVAGGVSGAGLNALDTAVRTDGDPSKTLQGGEIGGAIGAVTPLAGKVIGAGVNKLMSPAVDATTDYLMKKAAQFGIPIRPAQTSTSPFINKLDQMVPKIPGSGMGKVVDEQQGSFNRAVAKTFGEDADAITTDVMARAKKRIGSEFDHVAQNTAIRFDNVLGNDLGKVVQEAGTVLEKAQVEPLANRVAEIAKMAKTGIIDGEAYQNMMKKGAPLNRLMNDADPNKRYYAGQIKEALDDALQRSATPEMAQRLQQARLQYKNMKTVEDLAEKAPTGNVSPLLLMGQVRKSFPNMAYGGGGDLADLARIGQRFMKQPPDSGTPLGNKVLDVFTHAAPALAGAALGGGAAYHGGFDPTTDIGLGLGGLLATAGAARGASRFLLRPEMIENALTRAPLAVPAIKNRLIENQPQ